MIDYSAKKIEAAAKDEKSKVRNLQIEAREIIKACAQAYRLSKQIHELTTNEDFTECEKMVRYNELSAELMSILQEV